jgi:hypothetical protein
MIVLFILLSWANNYISVFVPAGIEQHAAGLVRGVISICARWCQPNEERKTVNGGRYRKGHDGGGEEELKHVF